MEKHSKIIATIALAIATLTLGMYAVPMASAVHGGGIWHGGHGGFHGGHGGFGHWGFGHGFRGWGGGGFYGNNICFNAPWWIQERAGCFNTFF